MAIQIYIGTLKELGSTVDAVDGKVASTTFSYIEFADGRILKNICAIGGLLGKIQTSFDSEEKIELHVMHGGKTSDLLVAIKGNDGRTFVTDLGASSWVGYVSAASTLVLGISLIPILGVGLVFIWAAWRTWHGLQLVGSARKHLSTLANAIVV